MRSDYPFAKFNRKLDILKYTDAEYLQHLQCSMWTKVRGSSPVG